MRLDVRSRSFLVTEALREFVERKAQFALGRFAPRFDECQVVFEDVNGPRGGIDKSCRVVVRGPGMVLRLEHRHSDAYAAASNVLGRLSRALGRRLGGPRPRRLASVRALTPEPT